jgi:hypothetical protein
VPLIVRPVDDGHELVAGYHRFAACRQLGVADVRVVVREQQGSTADSAAENVTREQLTPLEEARAVQAMLDEGYTADGAAQALGWSAQRVAARRAQRVAARAKILKLSDAGQRLVGTGALPLSAIDDLLRIGDVSAPVMEAVVTAIGRQVIDGGDFARNRAWAIGRSLGTTGAPFVAQLTTLRTIDGLRLGKTYTALMTEAKKLHRQVDPYAYGPPPVHFSAADTDQARAAGVAHQQAIGEVLIARHVTAIHRDVTNLLRCVLDDLDQVTQHRHSVMALVEHAHRAIEDQLFAVCRRRAAHDRDQRRHHHLPAPTRVGENLVARLSAQPRRRSGRLARIEDVEVPAAAAELDDLPAKRADEVDVIGLQVAEDQRHHAVSRQPQRHPADDRRLAQPGLAEREDARVTDQVRALKPRDRVAAHRRAGHQMTAERHADHRRPRTRRKRPQPARLHRCRPPLIGRLQIPRRASAATRPTTSARPTHDRGTRPAVCALGVLDHRALRISAGTLRWRGSTMPSGSAAANALSCEP